MRAARSQPPRRRPVRVPQRAGRKFLYRHRRLVNKRSFERGMEDVRRNAMRLMPRAEGDHRLPAMSGSHDDSSILHRIMRDLTNPKLIYLKGGLFLVVGVLCSTLLILEHPEWKVACCWPSRSGLSAKLLLRVLRDQEVCRPKLQICGAILVRAICFRSTR